MLLQDQEQRVSVDDLVRIPQVQPYLDENLLRQLNTAAAID